MKSLRFLPGVLLVAGIAGSMAWAFGWLPLHRGHPDAEQSPAVALDEYEKGLSCQNGRGVAKDEAEALRWFRQAAGHGHAGAQAKVGTAYATGAGVAESPSMALHWWRLAAAQGQAEGQVGLALVHLSGSIVPQDKETGVQWLRLAAAQSYAPAQYWLAECCLHGDGVAEDPAEAVRWYRKAAENGHAEAQSALGFICKRGLWGVAQDPVESMRWFERAAAQNHARAQYQLALCYAGGTAAPKDLVEALKWCLLASSGAEANASQWIKAHEQELTPGQHAEARARAQAFRP